MKLYSAPTSPFARKARIIIFELDLGGRVEEVQIDPWSDDALRQRNPLSQVPTLVLDDGSAIFDSRVICEYLNEMGGGKFYPGQSIWRGTQGRWRALGLQALGDGMLDAAVRCVRERRLPEADRNREMLARQSRAILSGLDMLERGCAKFPETPTIGEITIGCTLGYLDFRDVCANWQEGRPALSAWYERFARYPSMIATAPPA